MELISSCLSASYHAYYVGRPLDEFLKMYVFKDWIILLLVMISVNLCNNNHLIYFVLQQRIYFKIIFLGITYYIPLGNTVLTYVLVFIGIVISV